ncbi:MAG: S-adenosyl-l-methionine hydroxide adenosyltransferase family protein [Candidatus Methylacidiphilales bacterium]
MKKGHNLGFDLRWTALLLILPLLVQCQRSGESSMTPVIALITDFGDSGTYVPQMKGAILTTFPGARITDLNHRLQIFQVAEASYIVQKSTSTLPASAIVCAVVDPGVGTERRGIAFRTTSGRHYVGPDNGLFSHVLAREGLAEAVELNNNTYFLRPEPSATFHGRDIFGPVAAHLAAGVDLAKLGTPVRDLKTIPINQPSKLGDKINGVIVHVDHYGNIITNIHRSDLPEGFENKLVKVIFQNKTLTLPLVSSYGQAPEKRLFALLNSDHELELAVKQGSAAQALKPKIGEPLVLLLK